MPILRLEITDYTGNNRWRWVLRSAEGAFLADHEVQLDHAEPKLQALFDLPTYLRYHASQDKRDEDERRLLHEVGAWIGETVLGRSIADKILASGVAPITVRVQVPPEAERLLLLPLEIAHARGRPLALNGVSLVFEVHGEAPPQAVLFRDRLRLLALFSLPPVGSPLNLRRERQMLRNLVRRLTGAMGLAVELRVLQYGVTRDSLREALEDGEGWDVIHFSGHGLPGSLVLETPEGKPDLVSSDEISELLRLTGQRLQLVMLSACLSAAASVQQTLIQLGETEAAAQCDKVDAPMLPASPDAETKAIPTVARALLSNIDCAVLAMRYAVGDEFATNLADRVYEGLFTKKQSLPQALQFSLTKALSGAGGATSLKPTVGALSIATPALFGAKAANLKLMPPARGSMELPGTNLAYFPNEPNHFVGRVSAMTRASATLAVENDAKSGVLFHGMAGAGKTSCAVELTYHHAEAQRFRAFVWYEAPKVGSDIAQALRDFALAMERQLPSFQMVHVVDREDEFETWLPRLTEVLEHFAALVVLDNLESLLTETGRWRDDRWALLMKALLRPGGLSRVVLTSRIRPAELPTSTEVIAVHALPLDEAVLLMRELPNLRRLLNGPEEQRDLVRQTLRLVQGHPKLIQLSEALAAEPERLAAQLKRAEIAQTQGEGEIEAFFREGRTSFDLEAFSRTLQAWTEGIASALPGVARTWFYILCTIEEDDRESWLLEGDFEGLWKQLGRPEPVPSLTKALAPLVAVGLVEKVTSGPDDERFVVRIHPGVAEAGRAAAGPDFQAMVDQAFAGAWIGLMVDARNRFGKDPSAGPQIVRAGLSALPYLSRCEEWAAAAHMISDATREALTPEEISAFLPWIRRTVEATAGTATELTSRAILARLQMHAGQTREAEAEQRKVIAEAVDQGRFDLACSISGDLTHVLHRSGQITAAREVADLIPEYCRLAGLGPWTRLANERHHLRLFNSLGKHEEVLRRVAELREEMKSLPDLSNVNETETSWGAREYILDVGREAAIGVGDFQQALEFCLDILRSKRGRGAPPLDQARAQFNMHAPLLGLKRYDDAQTLLVRCREIAERENDVNFQGRILSSIAHLESERGRIMEAQHFEKAALRVKYLSGDAESIHISHFNLANSLMRGHVVWREVIAHRLAATFISVLVQEKAPVPDLQILAENLQVASSIDQAALPKNFDALCATVEQVEGVRFRELVERLASNRIRGDELLQQVLARVTKPGS